MSEKRKELLKSAKCRQKFSLSHWRHQFDFVKFSNLKNSTMFVGLFVCISLEIGCLKCNYTIDRLNLFQFKWFFFTSSLISSSKAAPLLIISMFFNNYLQNVCKYFSIIIIIDYIFYLAHVCPS